MNNNDMLIKIKHALDIKDTELVEIFKFGGIELSQEEVLKMLKVSKESYDGGDDHDEIEESTKCTNSTLESFLNGFIIFKRGEMDSKPGTPRDVFKLFHFCVD